MDQSDFVGLYISFYCYSLPLGVLGLMMHEANIMLEVFHRCFPIFAHVESIGEGFVVGSVCLQSYDLEGRCFPIFEILLIAKVQK